MNDKYCYVLIIFIFGLLIGVTTNTLIQKHIDVHTELKLCEQKYESYCIIKTPEIYCTTSEYNRLITTKEHFCGIIDETSELYGGIVKINNQWINKYWIKKVIW